MAPTVSPILTVMANLLYRLGRFAFRRRRLVAGVWALVLVVLAVGAVAFGGKTVDAFSIPGTESQQALDDLQRELPAAAVPADHRGQCAGRPDAQRPGHAGGRRRHRPQATDLPGVVASVTLTRAVRSTRPAGSG